MGSNAASLSLRSHRDELPALLAWVRGEVASRSLEGRQAIVLELAVEELGLNAMTHGRPAQGDGRVDFRLEPTSVEGELRLVIEDRGPAFDPTRLAAPAIEQAIEDRPIGGLGVHLVRTMARVSYQRIGDRNRVEVVVAAAPAGVEPPSAE